MVDDGPVVEQEQDRLLNALRRHLAAGRLDLEQFDARCAVLYAAVSRSGARSALDGLPLLDAAPPGSRRRPKKRRGESGPVQPH